MITDSHDYERFLSEIAETAPSVLKMRLPIDEKIYDIDLNTRKISAPSFLVIPVDFFRPVLAHLRVPGAHGAHGPGYGIHDLRHRDLVADEVDSVALADAYGSRSLKSIHTSACCLASYKPYILILYEMVESSDGIGAAAYACDYRIRKTSLFHEHLLLDLLTDNSLEVADDSREGVRSHDGTQAVMRI